MLVSTSHAYTNRTGHSLPCRPRVDGSCSFQTALRELPRRGCHALHAVEALFKDYNEENLTKNLTSVYAEKVYFRDAFKMYAHPEDILEYMIAGLEPLDDVEFVFNKVLRDGGDFYIDWTMRLDFQKHHRARGKNPSV